MPLMVHDLTGGIILVTVLFGVWGDSGFAKCRIKNAECRIKNAECRIICCGRGGTRFLYFADATVEMTDMWAALFRQHSHWCLFHYNTRKDSQKNELSLQKKWDKIRIERCSAGFKPDPQGKVFGIQYFFPGRSCHLSKPFVSNTERKKSYFSELGITCEWCM